MKYSDFEQILSHERLERYVAACGGNTKKAMTLYRLNLRLSQEVFTLISCFEVALRNSINVQLVHSLGNDWLRDCVLPGGRFQVVTEINKTCRIVNDTYQKLAHEGKYSHSHLLSKMEFGNDFSYANLRNMRQFYRTYPDAEICYTLCSELSWSHNRFLRQNICHICRRKMN